MSQTRKSPAGNGAQSDIRATEYSQHSGDDRPAPLSAAIRPVGDQFPSAEVLLLGALSWSLLLPEPDLRAVLRLVEPEDFECSINRDLYAAEGALGAIGKQATQTAVLDWLTRAGLVAGDRGKLITKRLLDVVTCGASELAAWDYAEQVVGAAYRRRFAGLAAGLGGFAESMPEVDLLPYLVTAGGQCRAHSVRLAELRGGAL